MKKVLRKIVSFSLAILSTAAVLSVPMTANAAETNNVTVNRISGTTRIDTAKSIAEKYTESRFSGTVILANGFNFPDALSGVALARHYVAPILLTQNGKTLEPQNISFIKSHEAKRVVILGGPLAVSDDIFNFLEENGCIVARVYGQDRFETNLEVVKECTLNDDDPRKDHFFVSSGMNFPDALSIAPVSYINSDPVIYCGVDGKLTNEALNILERAKAKSVTLIGGEYVVLPEVEKQLKDKGIAVDRVAGETRFDTSLAIYEKYKDQFIGNEISVATGMAFPDALAGGTYAGQQRTPLLLANPTESPKDSYNAKINDIVKKSNVQSVNVFGGEYVVTKNMLDQITDTSNAPAVVKTQIVTEAAAKVYTTVSTNSVQVGTLTAGQTYYYSATYGSGDNIWYLIEYKTGCNGWVFGEDMKAASHRLPGDAWITPVYLEQLRQKFIEDGKALGAVYDSSLTKENALWLLGTTTRMASKYDSADKFIPKFSESLTYTIQDMGARRFNILIDYDSSTGEYTFVTVYRNY